ncbi:hypothetical protein PISMIDRAFT_690196 [Pisolithus microcarpus 441]|uniref:Uncharacterized protein n=1 Tax=Pisolithus microcarpus 441 TaxID=765257 RepID=A0A0C9Y3F6_9AGAM|nr:hypothetical protein PISMIDRAFT_690196 [Pisolithus microcarpus 441]
MDLLIRFMLQLTPFASMHAVDDYAHVLANLVECWKWDVDAYRTYLKYAIVTPCVAFTPIFSPNIRANNPYVVLCALVFLVMAEWMRLCYSGLTSEEVKERIYAIGRRTFAILAVIPRLGVIIIRIVEIVVIADSPALACGLIVASMFPALIFPLILSGAQQLQEWITNRRRPRRAPEHNGAEGRTPAMSGHLESEQAMSVQPAIDDISVSLRYNERLSSS